MTTVKYISPQTFYVVGDIENSIISYQDAINLINLVKQKHTIIFLGDIYTPTDPLGSIRRIETIMKKLEIPILNFITCTAKQSSIEICLDIHNKLNQLFQNKNIEIYTPNNKLKLGNKQEETIKNILRHDFRSTQEKIMQNKPVFLFGNKELDIIRDLKNLQGVNIVDRRFTGTFKFLSKQQMRTETLSLSIHDLNILFTYLYMCQHFAFINNILMGHIYINTKLIVKYIDSGKYGEELTIKNIIAGHNRSFGKYFDQTLHSVKNYVTINLLDISHETRRNVRNYLTVTNEKIKFIPLDKCIEFMLNFKMDASTTFLKSERKTEEDFNSYETFLHFFR